jgi:hypothetical protein
MSFRSFRASTLLYALLASAAVSMAPAASALANTAVVDKSQVDALAAKIVQAVRTAEASADCQNKTDVEAQQRCEASIESAIEGVIAASGASPALAAAALSQAQTQMAQAGNLSTPDAVAMAAVGRIVQAQLGSPAAGGTNIGATVSSLGGPPSTNGGGGYAPPNN